MKYMGSKSRFSKYILPIVLKDRQPDQWYVEPFVGGANMIEDVSGNCLGGDSNKYVIDLLKYLSRGFLPRKITKREYDSIREFKHKYPEWLVGFAGICCSYSGKWFAGFAGETSTRQGVRDYQEEALNNIKKQLPKLTNVTFTHSEYNKLKIPENSIIYCDIPYYGTTKYKDDFYHHLFWQWCRLKSIEGHKIFVSEYNAPDDFICVWEQVTRSSLSANGKVGGSKESTEKLFTPRTQLIQNTQVVKL